MATRKGSLLIGYVALLRGQVCGYDVKGDPDRLCVGDDVLPTVFKGLPMARRHVRAQMRLGLTVFKGQPPTWATDESLWSYRAVFMEVK